VAGNQFFIFFAFCGNLGSKDARGDVGVLPLPEFEPPTLRSPARWANIGNDSVYDPTKNWPNIFPIIKQLS